MEKILTYICTGCDIGKGINVDSLIDTISSENDKFTCKKHLTLCNKIGLQLISEDIIKENPEGIVIAACSPRVHTDKFSYNENIFIERVNYREQLVWCHEANNEDTQMLAEDMLRMAIAKCNKSKVPQPFLLDEICTDILVVGGGITGITSAIEASKAGYYVHLVEKEQEIGGGTASQLNLGFEIAPNPEIDSKIEFIKNNERINVYTNTIIKEISGQPGDFNVILLNGKELSLKVGSVIQATGWKPYNAENLKVYNYEDQPNIITNIEFEKLAAEGNIVKPSDGLPPKNMLFVLCAGSRDKNHLTYCSNYCCSTTLKQAIYTRNVLKDTSVFIVYKDIRTPGQSELFYKAVQQDEQIFMTKGEVQSISSINEDMVVNIKNSLVGGDINLEVDLVVLAVGMTPNNSDSLNLTYRQGKELPELKYDFPDSHFICFPYETGRTGIYAAGTARAPMDVFSAIDDATGATLKAIQCIEATKRGEAVHPRSGDKSYPQLYMERCTDCKRCTEECPFGSYDETEKGTPLPNPSRCRRCGICLGACPERIINFEDYSIDIISSMIKAVHIPDEFEEKPRILAFICENDGYPALDMAGINRIQYSAYVRIVPVRCIGSVNKIWISDALSHGFDGILQIGCKPGDDYQCHFIQGSELTKTRAVNFQETLESMMLEPERVKTEFVEINEYHRIPDIIEDYMETIEEIGPNPFKGM